MRSCDLLEYLASVPKVTNSHLLKALMSNRSLKIAKFNSLATDERIYEMAAFTLGDPSL